jgi:hypothetical protein
MASRKKTAEKGTPSTGDRHYAVAERNFVCDISLPGVPRNVFLIIYVQQSNAPVI